MRTHLPEICAMDDRRWVDPSRLASPHARIRSRRSRDQRWEICARARVDRAMGGIMVLKTTRVRVYACDAGIKKSPIVKTGRRPTAGRSARPRRGARGWRTGEGRRGRAVQRDVDPETNMMQTLTHNATALRCATRSRAGVCAPDCTRMGSGGRVGLGRLSIRARGVCAARGVARAETVARRTRY